MYLIDGYSEKNGDVCAPGYTVCVSKNSKMQGTIKIEL